MTMAKDPAQLTVVEGAIHAAFDDIPFPGVDKCLRPNLREDSVEWALELCDWSDKRYSADYDFLGKGLACLTDEGLRYFVSGYMISALHAAGDAVATISLSISLLPTGGKYVLRDSFFYERTKILNAKQNHAIALFWEYARQNFPDELLDDETIELSHYWDQYL
jgi:hypothetical protein